jgi:hypothetical protein
MGFFLHLLSLISIVSSLPIDENNATVVQSVQDMIVSPTPILSPRDLYLQNFELGNVSDGCFVQLKKSDVCLTDVMFINQEKVFIPKNIEEIDLYCG